MSDSTDRIAATLYHLHEMMEKGEIEPKVYYKALVTAAYYNLKDKQTMEALNLLANVPGEYFRDDFIKHMEADPNYADIAYHVCDVLVKAGYIHVGFSEEELKLVVKA